MRARALDMIWYGRVFQFGFYFWRTYNTKTNKLARAAFLIILDVYVPARADVHGVVMAGIMSENIDRMTDVFTDKHGAVVVRSLFQRSPTHTHDMDLDLELSKGDRYLIDTQFAYIYFV